MTISSTSSPRKERLCAHGATRDPTAAPALGPVGVAVDGTGDVFVSDGGNQRIVEFTSVGAFVRAWGWGVTDGQSKLEVCTSICRAGLSGGGAGQFNTPWGLAVDASGDVFVADELNERVDEFSSGRGVRARVGLGGGQRTVSLRGVHQLLPGRPPRTRLLPICTTRRAWPPTPRATCS